MAYKVIILYQLYMPSYFLGTFTEYPSLILKDHKINNSVLMSQYRSHGYLFNHTACIRKK